MVQMWQFILLGDVLVMGMMILLVVWISLNANRDEQQQHMRIPLEDD
jgi:cbb3-type cytochrome oxidase subunit 3